MDKKGNNKLKGKLKIYMQWPLLLTILLCFMNLSIYFIDKKSGIVVSIFIFIYIIIAFSLYFYKRSSIMKELINYATSYGQVQTVLLKELSLPYAISNLDGHLLWANNEFLDIVQKEKVLNRSITSIFPEITKEKIPQGDDNEVLHVIQGERKYRVVLKRVIVEPIICDDKVNENLETLSEFNVLIAIYLYDETDIMEYIKANQEQKLTVALLYIDNYEEALDSIDEVRRSLLIALVDRKINKYMQSFDAIVKKLEKDKYIILFKQKHLIQLQETRFSLLDEVRAIDIGNEMSVTLSMGISPNTNSYIQGYEFARAAIDLALGRGGDQVVIKDGEKLYYYGGKSIQVEKNTRVKARVKAHALKELIEAKDYVIIMGHSIGDTDSFGAGIGIYRIAKTLNKRAYIVINEITTSVRPMINRFLNNSDYEEDMFLNSEQAKVIVNSNALLVVVDVNKPNYTECSELLDLTKTIVILDHHRQSGEAITNAVLSYIEPYASSTCEMIAEILQYIDDGLRLRSIEADAMYSGIMIDTDNFLTKTGVRTFEAAAFLRRNGADVTRIRKMFRSEFKEYKSKAEAASHMEVYMNYYAITVSRPKDVESPTVLGAKIANDLLNIDGIKASFVFTPFKNKIYISARSIDELNVQVVMEKLGGGGHISVAGAQLECTVEEAVNYLKAILSKIDSQGSIDIDYN